MHMIHGVREIVSMWYYFFHLNFFSETVWFCSDSELLKWYPYDAVCKRLACVWNLDEQSITIIEFYHMRWTETCLISEQPIVRVFFMNEHCATLKKRTNEIFWPFWSVTQDQNALIWPFGYSKNKRFLKQFIQRHVSHAKNLKSVS